MCLVRGPKEVGMKPFYIKWKMFPPRENTMLSRWDVKKENFHRTGELRDHLRAPFAQEWVGFLQNFVTCV